MDTPDMDNETREKLFEMADMSYVVDILEVHMYSGNYEGLPVLIDQILESIKFQGYLNEEYEKLLEREALRQAAE